MSEFYTAETRFLVAVDCIIFGFDNGELKLLLLKRRFEPAMGQWSLMGGFLKPDESMDEAAKRILADLTGLTDVYMEQLKNYGKIERDPGERVLSTAYYALIKITESDKALVKSHNACWIPINQRPELIFDHNKMVQDALENYSAFAAHNQLVSNYYQKSLLYRSFSNFMKPSIWKNLISVISDERFLLWTCL